MYGVGGLQYSIPVTKKSLQYIYTRTYKIDDLAQRQFAVRIREFYCTCVS